MSNRKDVSGRAGIRAEKKATKANEAEGGWSAYRAAAAATEAKSARLRALRLERDAAGTPAPAKPAPKKRGA